MHPLNQGMGCGDDPFAQARFLLRKHEGMKAMLFGLGWAAGKIAENTARVLGAEPSVSQMARLTTSAALVAVDPVGSGLAMAQIAIERGELNDVLTPDQRDTVRDTVELTMRVATLGTGADIVSHSDSFDVAASSDTSNPTNSAPCNPTT